MADLSKFEEMLERLVNEDRAGAEELFHEIVVERSRSIYESLLETDEEEVDEATDEEVEEEDDLEEATDEEVEEEDDLEESTDEEVEEDFDLNSMEVEGDAGDDFENEIEFGGEEEGEDEEGEGEEEGEGDTDARLQDLEDALDELKAEFEQMMADEEGEDHGEEEADDDMGDMGDEEEPEEESFAIEQPEVAFEGKKSESEQMREYVEKVSAKMGDNGDNTKSPVAGKNDMGGTASNIVAGGEAKGEGTNGGLQNPSTTEDNAGNVNVPGGKAGKSLKADSKGHGAEKKGKGDNGANTKSVIGK